MSESLKRANPLIRESETGSNWNLEKISEERYKALLPYTEFETVEEFKQSLQKLQSVLSRLPRRNQENFFLPRYGGPTKWEYVLYNRGRIHGADFSLIMQCLGDLGVAYQPIDELDREFVVMHERGKTTLELLGLVAGRDPDADFKSSGENWQSITNAEMQRAAQEDAGEENAPLPRNFRSFTLRGSDRPQRIREELKKHFSESMRAEADDTDPAELDAYIDDVATRFDEGSLTLDQAFAEMGLEVDEAVNDPRTVVPAGKYLGERLEGRAGRFRWHRNKLYRRGSKEGTEDELIPTGEYQATLDRAKPAAELLWNADALTRRAQRLEAIDGMEDQIKRLLDQAEELRTQADTLPDSLAAIRDIIEIHSGFVFMRVMRFLKRHDVQLSTSFGGQDLMQEGLLGLYRAIAKRDISIDKNFLAFAKYHVDGLILSHVVRNRAVVILPTRVQSDLTKLYDVNTFENTIPMESSEVSMDKDARAERRFALAEKIFGWGKDNAALYHDRLLQQSQHPDVISRIPIEDTDDRDETMVDMFGDALIATNPQQEVYAADTKDYLSQLLSRSLTPREEYVIRARFGLGMLEYGEGESTLETIGDVFGVTRERIRTIETKALRKLQWQLVRKFGKRDATSTKYIDAAQLNAIFELNQ